MTDQNPSEKGAINKRDIELLLHDYTRYLEHNYLPLENGSIYIVPNISGCISEYMKMLPTRIDMVLNVE